MNISIRDSLRLFLFILVSTFSSSSFPQPPISLSVPPDSEVLIPIPGQQSPSQELPSQVRVMVWNMLKAERENWPEEFIHYSGKQNLILLQENLLSPRVRQTISLDPSKHHLFAASFLWEKQYMTGVSNGSSARALASRYFRSPDREPFFKTPKMSLRQDFLLQHGRQLRVINTHGLNFTDDPAFEKQLLAVAEDLEGFDGPVIWAGDFNASSPERFEILYRITSDHGLSRRPTNDLPPEQVLDHAFVRGCITKSANEKDTSASDHPILLFDFICEPEASETAQR